MKFKAIIEIYVSLIKKGVKTIDEVPEIIKKEVEEILKND